MNLMEIKQIGKELLKSQEFIVQLRKVLLPNNDFMRQKLETKCRAQFSMDTVIHELSNLLNDLIKQKIEQQMIQIIEDNNHILHQIKQAMYQNNKKRKLSNEIDGLEGHSVMDELILTEESDDAFSDIHKLINEEKRKAMCELNDQALQKSISAMVQFKCQSLQERAYNMQKKIKALQDKFDTNMKSVWNVISMTEAIVFDHLKSQKLCKKEGKQNRPSGSTDKRESASKTKSNKNQQSFFRSFWK